MWDKHGIAMAALGLFFVFRSSAEQPRHPRIAPLLGLAAAIMLLLGVILIVAPRVLGDAPSGSPGLQLTSDGIASASFPVEPERLAADNGAPTVETYRCTRKDENVRLLLQFRSIQAKSDDAKLDEFIKRYERSGFRLEQIFADEGESANIHRLVFSEPNREATLTIRVVFLEQSAYNVAAWVKKGAAAGEEVTSFLDSFRVGGAKP